MLKIASSMYHIRLMDDLARQKTMIHAIHPVAKLLTTIVFLFVVLSFDALENLALLPLFLYPAMIMVLAEIPFSILIKRLLLIEPFILSIGLINSFFAQTPVQAGDWLFTRGQLMLISILLKSLLTISASLLLIMTTGIERLAVALQQLRLPKLLTLQLLLTYRYITVLAEELSRMLRAYFLRAPGQKGLRHEVWGDFSGQLLIRTYERAQRVYQSMTLRGYQGEFKSGGIRAITRADIFFILLWILIFALMRMINLPLFIAGLIS